MPRLTELLDTFRSYFAAYEQESRHAQLSTPPGRVDLKVVTFLVVAMVVLSLLDYHGGSGDWRILEAMFGLFVDDPQALLSGWFRDDEWGRLLRLSYWSGTTFLGYFIVPVVLIVVVFRDRLRNYGMPNPFGSGHPWLCLGLFLVMLPFVVAASFTESFQATYPFYGHADRSMFDFLAWQLVYAAQFFALEFFYRGVLIHGIKHRFGVYSILVSTIPYVMIHFGKPLPETLGSIVAGIALGALSYHLRSIWPGVFLHIAIALAMDSFSLAAQGRIGLF